MQTVNLTQGTPEWYTHRLTHWNASDAPAMMGECPHKSRTTLIHELATGLKPEFDAFMQKLLDTGHRFEALARAHIAEGIVGETLYPCVGVEGKLSASFDGLTMDERINFEHKRLNNELRACRSAADIPKANKIQMQQQMMVSGATRCLFVASEWDAADNFVDKVVFWYESDHVLAQQITDGWVQLARDVAAYVPAEIVPAPQTTEIMALPALSFEVFGEVKSSNLVAYQNAAEAFIANINTNLKTDDDFAQADKDAKFCKEAENKLALMKDAALSQTATIDELFRTIDHLSESLRGRRLTLERLIKDQKEVIKTNLILQAQQAFNEHIYDLNAELTGATIPTIAVKFAEVIKGKKSTVSMKSALSDELARLKIEADSKARTIRSNLTHLGTFVDYRFLFDDLQSIVTKDCEDFAALVSVRIGAHKDAQAMKLASEQKQTTAEPTIERKPMTHHVDLARNPMTFPVHLQNELRDLIIFAHQHGYAADTTELEYLAGGLKS